MNRITMCASLFLALLAVPLAAQNWSLGVASGPFLFGKFAERSQLAGNVDDRTILTTTLSAATRAGLEVDLERRLNDYFAVRAQASFTDAPLAVKSKSGGTSSGVPLDAGRIRVTTFVVPVVVQINPHGAFRFHILGGPAYASYDIRRTVAQSSSSALFSGSRGRFGGAAGAGVAWWWSGRFAVEGQILDIVTSSPLDESEFTTTLSRNVHIPKPQNVHTTIGIRYRF
jgi:opacity protein-like surface antigen